MQTFLPFSSFSKSAEVLDSQRLNKQRVECLQILNALWRTEWSCSVCQEPQTEFMSYGSKSTYEHIHNIIKTPWYNHPAVQMWKNYEHALAEYTDFICFEWVDRGFKDSCRAKINNYLTTLKSVTYPKWLGNEKFHSSHRAALLAKNFNYYKQFNWSVEPKIEYFWPSKGNL